MIIITIIFIVNAILLHDITYLVYWAAKYAVALCIRETA